MTHSRGGRVVIDVTTSLRWTGPPVGIVRVERELALWALANLPNARFAIFDWGQMTYCEPKIDLHSFLIGDAVLDTTGSPDPRRPGRHKTDRAPAGLRPLILWIGRFRRMMLGRLELARVEGTSPRRRRLAGRLQELLMSAKYRKIMIRADGTRRSFRAQRTILGAPIDWRPGDMLICAGAGWAHTDIETIRTLRSGMDLRFVLLCYDLIPLLFPQFYREHDVAQFRGYMHEALACADLVVLTSRKCQQDCQAYCTQHGIPLQTAIAPPGFDVGVREPPAGALPAGLAPGRFVLMVSTIEPRKGHRLLYNVWRRLIANGVTQAEGYKLVFVGRTGWMIDDLLAQIRRDRAVAGQILIMSNVEDQVLAGLYENAAFCVYPSQYEGFGLPVCEAYAHGKAVLVSNGGALPELAQGLSPCLDPNDEEAWYQAMKEWIEHPDRRVPFEQAVKRQFRQPSWSEAAANFFMICAAMTGGERFTDNRNRSR